VRQPPSSPPRRARDLEPAESRCESTRDAVSEHLRLDRGGPLG